MPQLRYLQSSSHTSLKLLRVEEERSKSFRSKASILLKSERRYPREISNSGRFWGVFDWSGYVMPQFRYPRSSPHTTLKLLRIEEEKSEFLQSQKRCPREISSFAKLFNIWEINI